MEILLYTIIVLLFAFGFLWVGIRLGDRRGRRKTKDYYEQEKIPTLLKDRLNRSRAVLGGLFSEQLAPFLPDFPFDPRDCRFIGKPIDFIVFQDLEEDKGQLFFVEVKSGKHKRLSKREQALKAAVEAGRVRWILYKIPDSLLKP